MAKERDLPGGFITTASLVDGTVRRAPTTGSPYVRRLLTHFEQNSWEGAPRHLGQDEQGREIFTFIEGHVPWKGHEKAVVAEESLIQLAGLVRAFHDLTAGHPLSGDAEVVCHNDLSPRNTVYRREGSRLHPVALIDWDLAAPGRRVHDLAHLCWQFLPLGPATDAAFAGARMRLVSDAYGLPPADRARLVETVLWWQDRSRRGIESGASAGDPAMIRLCAAGVPQQISAAQRWVTGHRAELTAALAAGSSGTEQEGVDPPRIP